MVSPPSTLTCALILWDDVSFNKKLSPGTLALTTWTGVAGALILKSCSLPVSSQFRSLAVQLAAKAGNGSVLHQGLLETGQHVHMEFTYTTLLTSIMIGSSLSYVHHSRHLTTFQSLTLNFHVTQSPCTPIEVVCLVPHGVNVQPQAGFGGHWYFIISSFPQMLVCVLAASCDVRWMDVRWTSSPAVAAMFPSWGTGAPMEAATFPSQGRGCPCKHSGTTRGRGVNLCSE